MVYAIKYTETYARTYFVDADLYDQAVEKLNQALQNDKIEGPNYCIDCGFFDVTNSYTGEELNKNIDVKEG